MILGLTPEIWRVIGYVRDAMVILIIVIVAMYVFDNPDRVDAFLNWIFRH
jgi:hypothetical protein